MTFDYVLPPGENLFYMTLELPVRKHTVSCVIPRVSVLVSSVVCGPLIVLPGAIATNLRCRLYEAVHNET